mmetsp:Transcript_8236/g.12160  ORF Transcript_8236/g.12160 Transcript_8236/m.12160 type:complete len:342 (+) Transcript_8236:3596-4621(+)
MCTGKILVWLGQDSQAAEAADTYMVHLVPGIIALVAQEALQRYLRSQNIFSCLLYISGASLVFHVVACYSLVHLMELGLKGAALASVGTYWVQFTLTVAYIELLKPCQVNWRLDSKSFQEWGPILRLGLPGVGMYMIEWWSFECSTIFAGNLGGSNLGAHLGVLAIFELMEMITLGVSLVVGTLVGNHLGEGKPESAQRVAKICLYISLVLCSFTNLVIVWLRDFWASLCTSDPEVVKLMITIMPIYAGAQFCDAINDVIMGVLTGVGQQRATVVINTIGCYAIGLPATYLFAFVCELEVLGIWLGVFLGNFSAFVLCLVWFLRLDWNQQALAVQSLSKKD